MVNNLVFRWPKPLFFMVLGAHGGLLKTKFVIQACFRGGIFHSSVFIPFFAPSEGHGRHISKASEECLGVFFEVKCLDGKIDQEVRMVILFLHLYIPTTLEN